MLNKCGSLEKFLKFVRVIDMVESNRRTSMDIKNHRVFCMYLEHFTLLLTTERPLTNDMC